MNISMAHLSIQLLLYAAAWLAVGSSVQWHRKASLSLSLGWLLSALASAIVVFQPPFLHSMAAIEVAHWAQPWWPDDWPRGMAGKRPVSCLASNVWNLSFSLCARFSP